LAVGDCQNGDIHGISSDKLLCLPPGTDLQYLLPLHNILFKVDWFEDEITDMHKKLRSKETVTNAEELKECVDMMRSHQDKKFKDELAKMKADVGILAEKE